MTVQSAAKISTWATRAGFPPAILDKVSGNDTTNIAVAIALAESGGDDAKTTGDAVGLWQISTTRYPDIVKGRDMLDPSQNAQAAYAIYLASGKSFAAWNSYNSGAYKPFLTGAAKAVSDPANTTTGQTISQQSTDFGGVIGFFTSIAKAFAFLLDPHNWWRLGLFVLGIIATLIGAIRLTGVGGGSVVKVAKHTAKVVKVATS